MLGMATLSGCKKAPLYDEVEQLWQLEEFTILETQETVKCERLFYNISRMITKVDEKQGPHGYLTYVARTEYRDHKTKLVLSDFRTKTQTADDKKPVDPEVLKPFGINNAEETVFLIVKVSQKQLILESDYARLTLKKF